MNDLTPAAALSKAAKAHPGPARVGIGGPVGSGKTRLLEQLIPRFRARGTNLAVITNDLTTKEDADRVRRSGLIDPERVLAVETGACPHTAIREDPTLNIQAAEELSIKYPGLDLILIESGGDNLASTFSFDLVDYWKVDLAPHVNVDLPRMIREAHEVRAGRPVLETNCAKGDGVDQIVERIASDVLFDR